MSKYVNSVLSRAVSHYAALVETVQRLDQAASFTPYSGYDVFRPVYGESTDEIVTFDVGPVTINLPVRGQAGGHDLYVVFQGKIGLDVQAVRQSGQLRTRSFKSRLGYFSQVKDTLEHVFGVHCDLDTERLAHPAFHAQLVSFGQEFLPYVQEQVPVPLEHDRMAGVLHGVRIPTAQLDFFAIIVQLAADHLLWQKSGDDERNGFNDLLNLDRQVKGLTPEITSMRNAAARPCHRAAHWYAEAPHA